MYAGDELKTKVTNQRPHFEVVYTLTYTLGMIYMGQTIEDNNTTVILLSIIYMIREKIGLEFLFVWLAV